MIKKLALCLGLLAIPTVSHADSAAPADAGIVDAGSASTAGPAPSSALHDPTTDPAGALSDVKAAKARWPLLVLVVLIGLAKVLPYLGGKLAPIGKWLAQGKRAVAIAAVGGLAASLYDGLASGGTWGSAGLVLLSAVFAYLSPHAPVSAQQKAAA